MASSQTSVLRNSSYPVLERYQTFQHVIDICLKDSNANGNTYFARYFEWQGVCRERWMFECIDPSFLHAEGTLMTKIAHNDFFHETLPFQKVTCYLNTFRVRQCSLLILFRFYADNTLISKGYQQIVFVNHARKISPFPEAILKKFQTYEVQENA